jgi:hypothetical protein
VRDWIAFHIGAPLVAAQTAELALGRWADLQPVSRFRIGQPDYPDRSVTLIVALDRLAAQGACLTGSRIETAAFRANGRGSRWGLTRSSPTAPGLPRCPGRPGGDDLDVCRRQRWRTRHRQCHAWLAAERRGDPGLADLSVGQIREQLALTVNRVMAEGSLYDPDLASSRPAAT